MHPGGITVFTKTEVFFEIDIDGYFDETSTYGRCDEDDEIILVANKARHLGKVPVYLITIKGEP